MRSPKTGSTASASANRGMPLAEARGVGRTVAYTSEIWPDHPEKVLACRRDFVERASEDRARAGADHARSVPLARRRRASQ